MAEKINCDGSCASICPFYGIRKGPPFRLPHSDTFRENSRIRVLMNMSTNHCAWISGAGEKGPRLDGSRNSVSKQAVESPSLGSAHPCRRITRKLSRERERESSEQAVIATSANVTDTLVSVDTFCLNPQTLLFKLLSSRAFRSIVPQFDRRKRWWGTVSKARELS